MSELKQAELPLSVSNEPQKDFKKIELPGFAEVENLATHILKKGGRVIAPGTKYPYVTGTVTNEEIPVLKLGKEFADRKVPAYKTLGSLDLYLGSEGAYRHVSAQTEVGIHGDYALEKVKKKKNK